MCFGTGVVDFRCDEGGVRGGFVKLPGGVVSDELVKLQVAVVSNGLPTLQGNVVRNESRD
jgi:hypothetical protein